MTFLATPNVPVNFVAVFVTVKTGDVPSPITKDAVPSSWTVRPSPDQAMSPHPTSGGVPDGFASDSVTVVPVGRSTPAGAAKSLPASSTRST